MSKLYVVGTGPGSLDYVIPRALKAVKSSAITIGSKRALDIFPEARGKIELNADNVQEKLKYAVDLVCQGTTVCVLSTGDPGFSGILKPLLKLADDIEIKVIPGISSIQLCAAKLQIPWDSADLITLHGKGVSQELMNVIDNGKPTIILPHFEVNEIARFLMDNGVSPEKKVAVCEKLSYPDERIVKTSLTGLLEENFSYMAVMVIY